jgi:hypothetical protein
MRYIENKEPVRLAGGWWLMAGSGLF